MSLRFSPDEAAKRGFISQEEALTISKGMRQNRRLSDSTVTPAQSAPTRKSAAVDPQQILFDALSERLPGIPEAEKTGLIPGRQFRVDIFIRPDIVVEMDGFQYHSSKSAFQSDRQRDNLFVAHGYRVFRTFTKEVLDEARRAELIELIVLAYSNKKN